MTADEALIRAWELGMEDMTDEVMDEYERLLPALVEAGYAADNGHTWNFTPEGVARAKELEAQPDEDFTREDFMRDLRKVAGIEDDSPTSHGD